MGPFAEFDPASGLMQQTAMTGLPTSGVYGELGGVQVIFYRDRGRLGLRVGDRTFDLDEHSVSVGWGHVDSRRLRFGVAVGGTVVCQLEYHAAVPELDLGKLIREVCGDPNRQATIFAH